MKQKNIHPRPRHYFTRAVENFGGGSLQGFMKRKKRQIATLLAFSLTILSLLAGLPFNEFAWAATSSVTEEKLATAKVELLEEAPKPAGPEILTFTAKVVDVKELFVYGLEINYDPAILRYKSATAGNFLNQNGKTATSFHAALENGTAGKLLVAEARTSAAPKTGVNGSGGLFTLQFEVIAGSLEGASTKLQFGKNSFISNISTDLKSEFNGASVVPVPTKLDNIKNPKAEHGSERFSLALNWDKSADATSYRVYRKNQHGEWKLVKEVSTPAFADKDGLANGGNLIPNLDYHYKIVAVKGAKESVGVEITAKDNRGLKGDNNRSDRVDGRDLEKLARHFGRFDTDKDFEELVDTTYDGRIDGNDLIDLGINFGKTYKP